MLVVLVVLRLLKLLVTKGTFGGYTEGFLIFAAVVLVALAGLSIVKTRWRTTWGVAAGGRI